MTEPHPHRFPGVTFAAIAAELLREQASRRSVYKRAVDKGTMDPREADWQHQLAAAWIADCARFAQALAPIAQGRPMIDPRTLDAGHTISWQDRRNGILRELDQRARLYPRWIDKGNLDPNQAAHQVRCLEAMLTLYEDGLDFPGTLADFAPYVAEILDRTSPAEKQKELAL